MSWEERKNYVQKARKLGKESPPNQKLVRGHHNPKSEGRRVWYAELCTVTRNLFIQSECIFSS